MITEYDQRQRDRAEECAPVQPLTEQEFVRRAAGYPLPVLRHAGMRYISARGRGYDQVIAAFVERLANPHANKSGDDFRVALGHIEATRRWMVDRGLI